MEETDHDWVALAGTCAQQVYVAARAHAPDDDAAWDAVQEAEDDVRVVVDPVPAGERPVAPPKAVVRGRVMEAGTGVPLPAHTTVFVRGPGRGSTLARLSGDGRFTCDVEPGRGLFVALWSLDWARTESAPFDLARGEERSIDLAASRGRPLRGRVVGPDERPVQDACAGSGRGFVTMDADGNFIVPNASPGERITFYGGSFEKLELVVEERMFAEPLVLRLDGGR
jgi:hypothetical protein